MLQENSLFVTDTTWEDKITGNLLLLYFSLMFVLKMTSLVISNLFLCQDQSKYSEIYDRITIVLY